VRVHDFVDEGLGHSSYVIDLGDGTAAIVDPPRFPIAHEDLADRLGVRIEWTIDTHSHADYVTGSPALAHRSGATFIAPAASGLQTPHRPVRDGERVALAGAIELVAIATPGHTPDHHAFILTANGEPVSLFSGGSLMVGTVGRTDLCGPDVAEELAHDMFRSLRRFDHLSDDLPVRPTHGAGSFCSAPGATQRTSSLGHERANNPLFTTRDEEVFVTRLLEGFGTFPSYFSRLPELNRIGPRQYDRLPGLDLLSPEGLDRHVAQGGVVVDARPASAFSHAHVPGSLSNTLRPVFASWLGWLVDAGAEIAFVLDDDQDRSDVVRQCLDVGHEQLIGELAGGIDAWRRSGRPVHSIPMVEADGAGGTFVDVRQHAEYTASHVPGAVNVELGSIADADLPPGPLTLMCGHGERAMSAASVLAARGRTALRVLDGGPDTWVARTRESLETGP
jgi:hydroxyacylglutathione hydrolase